MSYRPSAPKKNTFSDDEDAREMIHGERSMLELEENHPGLLDCRKILLRLLNVVLPEEAGLIHELNDLDTVQRQSITGARRAHSHNVNSTQRVPVSPPEKFRASNRISSCACSFHDQDVGFAMGKRPKHLACLFGSIRPSGLLGPTR